MDSAAIPENEAQRLAALHRYAVLDSDAEAEFDAITQFASALCGTPIALVSLVDAERQWFKSRVGLAAPETGRDIAFCSHAILGDSIFEVPDAAKDPRFADNPLVVGAPHIRFYAGTPLSTPDGLAMGTLCVIDQVPRQLSDLQRQGLAVLGREVIAQLELRRRIRAKDAFLAHIGHELRTPLNTILGLSELMLENPDDHEREDDLRTIHRAGRHLHHVLEDVLGYAQLELDQPRLRCQTLDLGELVAEVAAAVRPQLYRRPLVLRIQRTHTVQLHADPTKLRQIAYNLVSNAVKFTERGAVDIEVEQTGDTCFVRVQDTGIGIAADKLSLLFRDFSQVHADAGYGGTGLGLAISRRSARLMGGDITATSQLGHGSVFTLSLPLHQPG